MTVGTTLKSQHRNVLEFMTQAVASARIGKDSPSLLPEVISCDSDQDFLSAA
jgi:hypothetical protein